jgi:type I restriction enzyme R subunit
MASNFAFLNENPQFSSFAGACLEAEKSIAVSPATAAILSRRALELAVKWLYSSDSDLRVPYQDNLSSLIHDSTFRAVIEPGLFPLIKYVVKLGNVAAHSNRTIDRDEVVVSLHNLHQFVSSYPLPQDS